MKSSFRTIFDNAKDNRLLLNHLVLVISRLLQTPSHDDFKEALTKEANIIRLCNNLTDFDNKELATIYQEAKIPVMEDKNVIL